MIENESQYEKVVDQVSLFEDRLMADIEIPEDVDIKIFNAERQALRETIRELKVELQNYNQRKCSCEGTGKKHYSNTSGWMGGIGGQRFTLDLCDECWGSGNKLYPFRNLKYLQSKQKSKYFEKRIK